MGKIKISATVDFGTSLRVGYRVRSSISPFTYFSHYPKYNELPYTFQEEVPNGDYEVEVTGICPNCSGAEYSDPIIQYITVF